MIRPLAFAFALLAVPALAQPAAEPLELIVPLYVFPDRPGEGPGRDEWRRVAAVADRVPQTVVVNPFDGPEPAGTGNHTAYTEGLPILDGDAIRVIGYVRTCYLGMESTLSPSARPDWCRSMTREQIAAEVAADLEIWVRDYAAFVEGIFFDEAAYADDATAVEIYEGLCRDARAAFSGAGLPTPRILLNPGTRMPAAYTTSGDCDGAVLYESPLDGFEPASFAADVAAHGGARSGVLLTRAPDVDAMETAVEQARAAGATSVYVTPDGADGDPWDSVPDDAFWTAMADVVAEINARPTGVAPGPAAPLSVVVAPNPAVREARVRVGMQEAGPVRVVLHDAIGREVRVLSDASRPAGPTAWRVETASLAPGVYWVRVSAGSETASVPLTVVR